MLKFFRVPELNNFQDIAMLLFRVVAGLAFMFHGWGKIQAPFTWMGEGTPGILQALAAVAEFGGGFAWIIGLLMPLASLGMLCTMAVAVHFHAIIKGDPFVGHEGSYELALLYLVISIVFIAVGPGKFSLDRKFFGKRS